MASYTHGQPPIVANHQTTYDDQDAADWYGIWKLSDALFACTFTGEWCEYDLGYTPEQRYMGMWSTGVPVTELAIADEPWAADYWCRRMPFRGRPRSEVGDRGP